MAKRPLPRHLLPWVLGGVLLLAAAIVTLVAVLEDSSEGVLHDGAYVVASALFPVIAVGVAFSAVDAFREGRGPNPLGASMVVVAGVVALAAAGLTAGLDDGGAGGPSAGRASVDPGRLGISQRQNACSQVGFGDLPPLPESYTYARAPIPSAFREVAKNGNGVLTRKITEKGKTVASLLSIALGPQTQPNQDFLVEAGQTLKRQGVTLNLLGLEPFGALVGDLPKEQGSVVVAHGSCRAYYLAAGSPSSAFAMAKVVLDADQALKRRVAERLQRQARRQQG